MAFSLRTAKRSHHKHKTACTCRAVGAYTTLIAQLRHTHASRAAPASISLANIGAEAALAPGMSGGIQGGSRGAGRQGTGEAANGW